MYILVLMGGTSPEREVSLNSGKAVAAALRGVGHTVDLYDFAPDQGRGVLDLLTSSGLKRADVVFIALHGGEGEDGRIQALLELVGATYTGSGVCASAVCMNKVVSKIVFERHGLNTPAWVHLHHETASAADAKHAIEELGGLPVVTKPIDQGSTIGVSIVRDYAHLQPAIDLALKYSPGLILERYVAGKELSVSIVGDRVYPVIEIIPQEGFYDYRRKYTKGMTDYRCPAQIEPGTSGRIQREALEAYKAHGCEGFGRVDLRLGEDGVPYFLEINTIPGMTETSLVPMAAQAEGITFPQLVDRIATHALEKAGIRNPKTGG